MRTFILMTLVFLLNTLVYAQTNYSTLLPAEMVREARNQGAEFTATDIFTLYTGRTVPDVEVADFTLLQGNEELHEKVRALRPETIQLALPTTGRSPLQLDLVRVDPFAGMVVTEASTGLPVTVDPGVHYRGVLHDDPASLVAISFNDGEMSGLITSPTLGNLVLGKLPESGRNGIDPEMYILYNDADVWASENFECGTSDAGAGYTREELSVTVDNQRDAGDCVRIYFEVDHDIYADKGGTAGVTNYVTALFNQVAILYANEQVNLTISELFIWDTGSPYAGTTSGALLSQFQSIRTSFNGDLAQLLSYQASGGIAVLNGLCHSYTPARMSFSSIGSNFNNVPTYSFTVLVVAHELGHLLGSYHTHACKWNGNDTAIDGCAGFTEGGCPNPGLPSGGGTIMSYCHITSVGIDLSRGFGVQPGSVIRNKIANASCTQACPNPPGGGGGGGDDTGSGDDTACAENTVYLILKLDDFSPETTWELRGPNNVLVKSGGPYEKTDRNQIMRDTFCLPEACYTFTIKDEYGDGVCCDYGQGSYKLEDDSGNVITDGSDFDNEEVSQFCLPYAPDNDSDCLEINFNNFPPLSYGTNQDAGQLQVQDNGQTLFIQNNAWKAVMLDYTITPQTVLKFDFRSTKQGEIHGIGFDDNDNISYNYTFKVHGTQTWGLANYDTYPDNGNWVSYTIPVGQFYQGDADRLFFVADHDGGNRDGNSWFRNVRIIEGNGCGELTEEDAPQALPDMTEPVRLFPNPVDDEMQVRTQTSVAGNGQWTITDTNGRNLRTQAIALHEGENTFTVTTSQLSPGAYLLRWVDSQGQEHNKRFIVSRR